MASRLIAFVFFSFILIVGFYFLKDSKSQINKTPLDWLPIIGYLFMIIIGAIGMTTSFLL